MGEIQNLAKKPYGVAVGELFKRNNASVSARKTPHQTGIWHNGEYSQCRVSMNLIKGASMREVSDCLAPWKDHHHMRRLVVSGARQIPTRFMSR